MAHFKRKQYRSSMMKRCSICGSQRRYSGNSAKKGTGRHRNPIKSSIVISEQLV